jgi:thiol-disulfide isomerase/thioredoxin
VKKLYMVAAVTVAAISLALGMIVANRQQATPNKVVTELMASTLPDSDAKPQKLAQWQGKIIVLNFWATWCAPCVKEMPELALLQKKLAHENVQLIGIGIDDPINIASFSKAHPVSYPLLVGGMDGSGLLSKLGNTEGGLPFTVLITPSGRITKTYLGSLKLDVLQADIKSIR